MSAVDGVSIVGSSESTYTSTALMACAAKGLDVRHEETGFDPVELAQHHPYAKIPVLRHGERRVFETLAIAVYLDLHFDGPLLVPASTHERVSTVQWFSACSDYIYGRVVLAADDVALEAARPLLTPLNHAVERQRFLATDHRPSIADLLLVPMLDYIVTERDAKYLRDAAYLDSWLFRMKDLPMVARYLA